MNEPNKLKPSGPVALLGQALAVAVFFGVEAAGIHLELRPGMESGAALLLSAFLAIALPSSWLQRIRERLFGGSIALMLALGLSGCATQSIEGRAAEAYGTWVIGKRLATCLTFTATTAAARSPDYCANPGEVELPLRWKLRLIDAAQLASPPANAVLEGVVFYLDMRAGLRAGINTEEDVEAARVALERLIEAAEGDIDAFFAVLEEF